MPDSGSYLANAAARRRGLLKAHQELLDRPGVARRGGPPPPTAPAQDRVSPQEEALEQRADADVPPPPPEERRPEVAPEGQPAAPEKQLFDEETRAMLLDQIRPFLSNLRQQKMAQLHRRVGRVRRFFGSGV